MGARRPPEVHMFPSDLEFAVFTPEEIRKLSVVKIITGLTFDALGHPIPGGLYDIRLGSYGRCMDPCGTCLKMQDCPGHMGHIELGSLVYNPFFIKLVQRLLCIFCLHCHKLQMRDHESEIIMLQLRLIDAGYIIEAQELELFKSEVVCQNTDEMVKLDNGDAVHPRIAAVQEMLAKNVSNASNATKTSCSLRTAITHAALQRGSSKKCRHCNKSMRFVRYLHRRLVYYVTIADMKERIGDVPESSGQNKVIFADECRRYLRKIYENYPEFLKLLVPVLNLNSSESSPSEDYSPVDIFFMDTIPVTPPRARPMNVINDMMKGNPQTDIYVNIIENNHVLNVILKFMKGQQDKLNDAARAAYQNMRGASGHEKLYNAWLSLQSSVDVLLDVNMSRDIKSAEGLKQVLEKKEGLIRKHMMGKRVNYAARTVITPDPNIDVDEIGIPDIFARKLSYPVPVTEWNVIELRKMVMNGPDVHPGANYIQDSKGLTTYIPADNAAKRASMAKLLLSNPKDGVKIVHRHVLNGDVLLLNRQPSLHKPSIMAHKARILHGEKTFRLHYSNCKAYNADFDGDEMNAHYPQSEVARAEAYNLVNVASNYLVPKDGTPLGGLIQDQVISGVKLSIRGRFFNREDYQQLVFQGLSHLKGNVKLLPPAILKPAILWSGKQVLSTIIINLIPDGYERINLDSFAKIGGKNWNVARSRKPLCGSTPQEQELSESQVQIRNGELLVGVLDKQQYGATTFGLIHCMYELYGGDVSTRLLTAFTKVFTFFLQLEGFTLGVKDILVTEEADRKRRKIIHECRDVGNSAVAAALELDDVPPHDELAEQMEAAYVKDAKFRVLLDRKYKSMLDGYTNDINKTCLPGGLISKFPSNNLQLMVLSGAKGSMVNTMQISCLLGQIELEGKRPPLMISGKSLPSFTSFETSPKSGGFIDGRFMTGIQPQDFFFHCMAGREGLIDTAVKTSRSGYLQRCLIKHLEGLSVHYDLTVRDSDNSVVQFLYGEDGLDILKAKFFNGKFCADFLTQNAKAVLRPSQLQLMKDEECLAKVKRHEKHIKSWQKKKPAKLYAAFTHFSKELRNDVEVDRPNEINAKTGRRRFDEGLLKLWKKADAEDKALYRKKYARCPDPTVAVYKQDNYYGSVSERTRQLIEDYAAKHPAQKHIISDIMHMKSIKALASPGEPVGLIAAQSIGEPSTQMTLNTFHFAGRGEMNVTLGIPRLREILMLASSNIKTPSMDIPIKPGQQLNAEKLRISLNCVTLASLLESVHVNTSLTLEPERAYVYDLHFKFLPREMYKEDFCVRPKRIIKYMHQTFFKQLIRAILKVSNAKKTSKIVVVDEKKEGGNRQDEDNDQELDVADDVGPQKVADNDDDSSDDGGDDDATGIKLKQRKTDENDYDDPDDVEEIIDANDDEDEHDEEDADGNEQANEENNEVDDKSVEKLLSNQMVQDYTYDKDQHLWCRVKLNLSVRYQKPDLTSIIRELAAKSIVHQVPHIKRAIIYKGNDDEQLLKTDGINIGEMFQHNKILDLNRLYSNDIHAIARTYGIEAATQVIVKEVSNVFKVYGITVDRRHLSLIADYMTFDGTFQPLSRKGMEHSSSPLQQMSFESSLQFLRSAAGFGRPDELNSPSSRLMVGLPVRNGTGAFELLTRIC
ncbi:PREDICTED: DNA-directed RNA polymerase I subunit RPA1 [Drosophila arizonae]|uniref:DNA-directed RNA polymerase subunit n=1 Tax=Drosophila arizonae TaxID=7263 RepID=A0ABM1PFW2_DROAR|nr:PREDICTED: DNA-directed RNA polymerase I subunit RPA1 [Drosophila arizonae]XP_017866098.1 PREDICTED: DNA-directed RNA polymerase I subunit RPA1 [Drosophila arizonae]